jgi:DNA-binding PadR family transcriptional regulator
MGPRERALLAALRRGPLSLDDLAAAARPAGIVAPAMRRLLTARLVRMRLDLHADPPAKIYRLTAQGRQLLRERS